MSKSIKCNSVLVPGTIKDFPIIIQKNGVIRMRKSSYPSSRRKKVKKTSQ